MSRARRIISATAIGYLHQATVILVGLWLTPFLLHRIGQHDLGLWMVAGQILGYLALMDLGVIAILPREVAFASGESGGSTAHIAGLIARVQRIVRWQLLGIAAICIGVWALLPHDWEPLRWPLAWVFGAFVVGYPLRVPTAALQGLQELPFLAKAQMAGWGLSTILTVGLVLSGSGLPALVAGWIAGQFLPAVAATWRLRRVVRPSAAPQADGAVAPYFHRSIWVSVGQIAQVLVNGSDVLLVGRILGAAAVVPYSCTGKLVTVFANHPQLLMHAAQPALSELRGSGSRDRLVHVSRLLSQAMLLMSGALVVLIIPANHFFVNWWVGPSQFGGVGLTLAFTLMMLLRHWNVAIVYTLFCFGYERQLALTNLFDGVVTFVATPILIWKFGLLGAPVASMLGAGLVSLPVNLRSVAKEMDLDVATFIGPFAPLVARVLLVIGIAVGATLWSAPVHLFETALLTAGVTLLYLALTARLVWRGPLRPYIDSMLASVFRRDAPPPLGGTPAQTFDRVEYAGSKQV